MRNYNIILAVKSYLLRLGIIQVLEELKIQASICECANEQEVLGNLKSMDMDTMIMDAGFENISQAEIVSIRSAYPLLKLVQIKHHNHKIPSFIDAVIDLNDDKRKIFQRFEDIFRTARRPKHQADDSALSKREIDILKLVARGNTNNEIAEALFISTHTVISHRKNISRKLGIKSVAGLSVYAILNNYIDGSVIR